jgi:uncharacterized protein YxjI
VKYYIKQKVFSIGDKYEIYDENETPVFNVKGEIFTIGSKLHLYDLNDKELYYIKRRVFTFLPKYEIYQDDKLIANATKQFTFFVSRITIESDLGNFEIDGDFISHEYTIYCDGQQVASIHKKWLSWGDSYEIEISDKDHISFYLALVITIDNCMHENSHHSSSNNHHS